MPRKVKTPKTPVTTTRLKHLEENVDAVVEMMDTMLRRVKALEKQNGSTRSKEEKADSVDPAHSIRLGKLEQRVAQLEQWVTEIKGLTQ